MFFLGRKSVGFGIVRRMNVLPPDRSHIRTEQRHEKSINLDTLTTGACIELMIEDHARVREAVSLAAEPLARLIDDLTPRFRRGGRLIYIGAGTSGRLGVLDASECPPTFQVDPARVVGVIAGGDAAIRRSSEGAEDNPEGAREALEELRLNERDTVLGIAAGGTTPYVIGALGIAHAQGALTGLLTCTPEAERQEPAAIDHEIFLDTGPELLTGSTRLKAGSATKLALNIISTTLFIRLGKVYSNLMVDLRATNAKLRDRAIRILIELCSELDRQAAVDLLARAEGDLKTAIVMQRLDVEAHAARELLDAMGGRLRDALGG